MGREDASETNGGETLQSRDGAREKRDVDMGEAEGWLRWGEGAKRGGGGQRVVHGIESNLERRGHKERNNATRLKGTESTGD